MVSRWLTALWMIALALMVVTCLVDIARDVHSPLALVAVIVPLGLVVLVRARGAAQRMAPVAGVKAGQSAAVFRQLSKPDQVRIASLVASGNAIGAIKELRTLVDIDLRTAKDAVDQLAAPTDDWAV